MSIFESSLFIHHLFGLPYNMASSATAIDIDDGDSNLTTLNSGDTPTNPWSNDTPQIQALQRALGDKIQYQQVLDSIPQDHRIKINSVRYITYEPYRTPREVKDALIGLCTHTSQDTEAAVQPFTVEGGMKEFQGWLTKQVSAAGMRSKKRSRPIVEGVDTPAEADDQLPSKRQKATISSPRTQTVSSVDDQDAGIEPTLPDLDHNVDGSSIANERSREEQNSYSRNNRINVPPTQSPLSEAKVNEPRCQTLGHQRPESNLAPFTSTKVTGALANAHNTSPLPTASRSAGQACYASTLALSSRGQEPQGSYQPNTWSAMLIVEGYRPRASAQSYDRPMDQGEATHHYVWPEATSKPNPTEPALKSSSFIYKFPTRL
ncbi:hypothetical protein BKA61DRAFT_577228 [Leptodontidium sp. MPI-SDFR-AT-0119]|nr:hypothetical protein BKA61DRAFT_577228 [Leptodontidium sp. MPI-SDFR-AT-0119]